VTVAQRTRGRIQVLEIVEVGILRDVPGRRLGKIQVLEQCVERELGARLPLRMVAPLT